MFLFHMGAIAPTWNSRTLAIFSLYISLYPPIALGYFQLLINFSHPPAQLRIDPEIPHSYSRDRN